MEYEHNSFLHTLLTMEKKPIWFIVCIFKRERACCLEEGFFATVN